MNVFITYQIGFFLSNFVFPFHVLNMGLKVI